MGSANSKPPNNPMEREIYFAKLKEKRLKSEQKDRERLEKTEKRNLVKKNILQKFHMIKSNNIEKNYVDNNSVQQTIKDSDINILQKTSNNHYTINSQDYDLIVATKLKTQISEEFTNFLINQMLLSIQFFVNFEKDKNEVVEKILKKENHKNKKLEKHTIILTNVLDEAIKKVFQYQPRHGIDKSIQTPIQIPTMYIVFENIEISKPDDANYDVILPTCPVDIDTEIVGELKKFQGYLRLKLRDEHHNGIENNNGHSKRNLSSLSDDSDIAGNGNNFSYNNYSTAEYDVFDDDKKNINSYNNEENDYGYITSLNIHQPLAELKKSRDIKIDNNKLLPEKCITIIRYHLYENQHSQANSSSDDESIASDGCSNDNYHRNINSNVIEEKYLNSKSFLSYFATLLEEHLAKELNFSTLDLENATWKGASIFTKKYETIPAINLRSWPDCAFEWKLRSRPIRLNPLSGKKFQWPTQDMIKKIESFGCHVIPYGYAPKTKKNPYRDLEWKIIFPKGERYLEQHLTNTQVKVLILVKVLLKTFLDPELNDAYQFNIDFIKMHMFWECEENYLAWPEEYLGEVLIRFLQSFVAKTRSKHLSDYFIRGRNLFHNIPDSILILVHNTITDIIQNPVIHIIAAYRNLVKLQDFFPQLNYREIFKVISIENPLTVLNTLSNSCIKANKILEQIYQKEIPEKRINEVHDNDNELEQRGLIGYAQVKEKQIKDASDNKRTVKKRIKNITVKRKSIVAKQLRRESVDSIDVCFYAGINLDDIERPTDKTNLRHILDNIRRTLIIEMFIKHFLLLAENSYKHQSIDQAQLYLKQSTRLTYLLKVYQYETAANEYLESIQYVINKIRSESEFPPALPKRTSLEPVQSFRTIIDIDKKSLITNADTNKSLKIQNDASSAVEPRMFSIEADVHEYSSKGGINRLLSKEKKTILKQCSFLDVEKICCDVIAQKEDKNEQNSLPPGCSLDSSIDREKTLNKNKSTTTQNVTADAIEPRSFSIEEEKNLDDTRL